MTSSNKCLLEWTFDRNGPNLSTTLYGHTRNILRKKNGHKCVDFRYDDVFFSWCLYVFRSIHLSVYIGWKIYQYFIIFEKSFEYVETNGKR